MSKGVKKVEPKLAFIFHLLKKGGAKTCIYFSPYVVIFAPLFKSGFAPLFKSGFAPLFLKVEKVDWNGRFFIFIYNINKW